jgi:hypothetical protein
MIVVDTNQLSRFLFGSQKRSLSLCVKNSYHFCLTPAQQFRSQNRYCFIINTLYVKKDFTCFEYGSVVSSDYELRSYNGKSLDS